MKAETLLVKPLLEKAAADRKCEVSSAKAMRLAVFRHALDCAKVKLNEEQRKAAWLEFEKTPGWFGSNASAGQAALGLKGKTAATFEEFNV